MNIISIDLPWSLDLGKKRFAVAVADGSGSITVEGRLDEGEVFGLIENEAQSKLPILLDVPIDGCENLGAEHYRPVDRAIQCQGIWALPASGAGERGRDLREQLRRVTRGMEVEVREIYPYAIFKLLSYLEGKNLLWRIEHGKFERLLDKDFRGFVPPKYKRAKPKEERLKAMRYLYRLLNHPAIGLRFSKPLSHPEASSNLARLADEYDACLGVVVGMHFAHKSDYAWIAGDSNSGEILLLADRWLAEQLGREVQICNSRGREYAICSS